MFKKAGKRKFLMLMAPVSLAAGLSLGTLSAHAGTYVTSSNSEVVYGGFDECWNAVSGTTRNLSHCGDVTASPIAPVTPIDPAPAMDSDSDGVIDAIDECPSSLYGAVVNSFGCFEDSDNDGVADSQDRCPGSAAGANVDMQGCALITTDQTLRVVFNNFAFDKADTIVIKPADQAKLANVAQQIQAMQRGTQVNILGYTDSIGPEAYNLKLSERRAQSIADYLANLGVRNITVKGMGETSFVGDNDTSEGRAMNRRIELIAQ